MGSENHASSGTPRRCRQRYPSEHGSTIQHSQHQVVACGEQLTEMVVGFAGELVGVIDKVQRTAGGGEGRGLTLRLFLPESGGVSVGTWTDAAQARGCGGRDLAE